MFIRVQSKKFPSITIGCMYRHPKAATDSFDYIAEVLRNTRMQKRIVFILGDLNDNLLIPNSKLSKIIGNHKLTQFVHKPTRITLTSSTLLDVIITNRPDFTIHVDVVTGAIADHDLILVTDDTSKPKRAPITKTVRDLSNYSSDSCHHLLNHAPTLNTILQTDDVNAQVDVLTSVFICNLNSCAPMTTKVISRPPAPWIDDDISEAMSARNKAQRILKRDRLKNKLQYQYKILKKQVKCLIARSKNEYYLNRLRNCKGNSAATWKIIKYLVPNKNNDNLY